MEKIIINRYKIAGGNTTSLIEGCPTDAQRELSLKELKKVEQVGFVDSAANKPKLTMMGNELCVNATLAFAKQIGALRGEVLTSGLVAPVKYRNFGELTSVILTMNPEIIRDKNIVLFDGIGYVCSDSASVPTESYLSSLAKTYKKPAFGIARYQGDSLQPYVYVEEIGEVIAETACGSGSIALNLITGARNITQVTGQRISVMRNGDQFTVTAKVAKMK